MTDNALSLALLEVRCPTVSSMGTNVQSATSLLRKMQPRDAIRSHLTADFICDGMNGTNGLDGEDMSGGSTADTAPFSGLGLLALMGLIRRRRA
ncbi:MAG: hypothetical protein ACJATT_001801 [Myxococcota bacterium]